MSTQPVIVTGASSGIGKEIARYFLQKGDNVVINSATAPQLEETYHELGAGPNLARVAGTSAIRQRVNCWSKRPWKRSARLTCWSTTPVSTRPGLSWK